MAGKKNAKKAAKVDEDEKWSNLSTPKVGSEDESATEHSKPDSKPTLASGFAALEISQHEEGDAPESDEDEAGGNGGGLMAAIKKAKQKKTKAGDGPLEVSAAAAVEKEEEEEDGPGHVTKVLSKKEKEKLKKEKEKAKKKAQAAAKKSSSSEPSAPSQPPPMESSSPKADHQEEKEEKEEGAEAEEPSDPKNKKKKKKGKKDAAEAVPAPPKKISPALAALRAAMEAKKAAEEAERQRIQDENERLEREEAEREAEEKRLEEEKQRRKEKEKAKREQAKADGRLLTAAQKKQKQQLEQRREALLASGVKIEALDSAERGDQPKKKVVYGKKKSSAKSAPTSAPTSAPPTPDPASAAPELIEPAPVEESKEPEPEATEDVSAGNSDMGEWDASSEEEVDDVVEEEEKKSQSADDDESSEDDSDSSDESDGESSEDEVVAERKASVVRQQEAEKRQAALERREAQRQKAMAEADVDNLRSPICCIMGHVDTGKTKLLDKIRQTNVQSGEAGGITQQIGATYFPVEAIKEKTKAYTKDNEMEYKIPGLLIIDTPGHEAFRNLRTRGSEICNIAILVIDIMHGLEPQTRESIELLRKGKTPFIVAVNKIDRLYEWNATPDGAFRDSLANQKHNVQKEFYARLDEVKLQLSEQGLNSELYYDNKSLARTVSLVPTSAHTGEGIPDMIALLVKLTQERMSSSLMYLSELACTVLEVKVVEGVGTTIDVILSNGILHEGDEIVVCGTDGPIVTNIRALLMPQPLRELRIKSAYVHHKEVKASQGVKIVAPGLEKAIAGSRLLVNGEHDNLEDLRDEVMGDLTNYMDHVSKLGVWVQASTLGSLEALFEHLKNECSPPVPISGFSIGPVHKRDVIRALPMVEKNKEFACMLCFDVPIEKEAEEHAAQNGVKIFTANIIYHLFDSFKAYREELKKSRQQDNAHVAVWPVRLRQIQAFTTRDPFIVGCDIIEGTLRVGTPLCVIKTDANGKKQVLSLGKVTSLEINKKPFQKLVKSQVGAGVAVKIERSLNGTAYTFGRQFDLADELTSEISRRSIDALKTHFAEEITKEDKLMIVKLKKTLHII